MFCGEYIAFHYRKTTLCELYTYDSTKVGSYAGYGFNLYGSLGGINKCWNEKTKCKNIFPGFKCRHTYSFWREKMLALSTIDLPLSRVLRVQGTIFPAPNFNPVMDAQMLGGALQGFDCNKDMLIDILTQRSNAQRQMIAGAYQSMYGQDLIADLKEQLSSHFKEVMVGLMYPPPSYDAHELWHAMKGAGTDENCLIEILASRTNGEIFQMREAYYLQYSNNLQEDIYSETSGHFRDTLMNLVQGNREEGYSDPAMAAQDAMVLWEACQQKTGEHKTMMQMILCNKSYPQLWLVFQEFQSISGQDLVDAINDCYDGYFQELLIAIVHCVQDKPSYFAYKLYRAIHDFGFHNKTVIRILIARSEIDLMTIRKRYKERFGKSLFHDIKNFASGHYEKALLAICAGDVQDY